MAERRKKKDVAVEEKPERTPRRSQPAKTRSQLTQIKKSKNGRVEKLVEPTILAVLEPNEMALIQSGGTTLAIMREQLRLAQAGQNAIWAAFREKYDLPEEFVLMKDTGEVVEKTDD